MAWPIRRGDHYLVGYREGGRDSPILYKGPYPTKAAAKEAKAKIELEIARRRRVGEPITPERTFGDYGQVWQAGRTVRRKTADLEKRLLKNHLFPKFANVRLGDMRREQVRGWVGELTQQRGVWVARRSLGLLKTILEEARKDGHMPQGNTAWDVPLPPPPHREMRVPSVQEVCVVLKALPKHWRPHAFTAALTGMRWGEITALEWGDLDLDARKLHVRRALPANTREVGAPKSWAGRRTIDLFPEVRQALLDLPQRAVLVFPAERGGYLNHRWFLRAVWREARKTAGVGRLRWHDLRHFYASLLFAFGESPLYVAAQMGHGGPHITLKVYSHLMAEGRRLPRRATLALIAEAAGVPSVSTRKHGVRRQGIRQGTRQKG